MASLYFGIRLPSWPFERLKLTNIDLMTKNVVDIKIEVEKLIKFPHKELEFIYCGTVLNNDTQTLQEYGIRANTMIQVFQKQYQMEYKSEQPTMEQIQNAVSCYRAIFKEMASSSTAKAIRPEIMKQILETYPEFHSNLGAFAILRDSILIQSMGDLETVKNIAKQYPILIHSAQFVTNSLREHLQLNNANMMVVQQTEDSSDLSSSDSDSPAMSNQRSGDIFQISRDQLLQALLVAESSSTNSLSNIAQRNQSQAQMLPSTSSSTSSPSTSALISNSMFSNALTQALNATGTNPSNQSTDLEAQSTASATSTSATAAQSNANEHLAERYVNELQTMREMGLYDEMVNIQALIISNGDVEQAINLILSGLTNFN